MWRLSHNVHLRIFRLFSIALPIYIPIFRHRFANSLSVRLVSILIRLRILFRRPNYFYFYSASSADDHFMRSAPFSYSIHSRGIFVRHLLVPLLIIMTWCVALRLRSIFAIIILAFSSLAICHLASLSKFSPHCTNSSVLPPISSPGLGCDCHLPAPSSLGALLHWAESLLVQHKSLCYADTIIYQWPSPLSPSLFINDYHHFHIIIIMWPSPSSDFFAKY